MYDKISITIFSIISDRLIWFLIFMISTTHKLQINNSLNYPFYSFLIRGREETKKPTDRSLRSDIGRCIFPAGEMRKASHAGSEKKRKKMR